MMQTTSEKLTEDIQVKGDEFIPLREALEILYKELPEDTSYVDTEYFHLFGQSRDDYLYAFLSKVLFVPLYGRPVIRGSVMIGHEFRKEKVSKGAFLLQRNCNLYNRNNQPIYIDLLIKEKELMDSIDRFKLRNIMHGNRASARNSLVA